MSLPSEIQVAPESTEEKYLEEKHERLDIKIYNTLRDMDQPSALLYLWDNQNAKVESVTLKNAMDDAAGYVHRMEEDLSLSDKRIVRKLLQKAYLDMC